MEATGGYESLLVKRQHEHPMARAAVNPRQVPDFAQGLASPQAAQSGEHIKLRSLVERRRKLHDLGSHEQNRLLETMDAKIRKSIPTMLSLLPGRRSPENAADRPDDGPRTSSRRSRRLANSSS